MGHQKHVKWVGIEAHIRTITYQNVQNILHYAGVRQDQSTLVRTSHINEASKTCQMNGTSKHISEQPRIKMPNTCYIMHKQNKIETHILESSQMNGASLWKLEWS